MRGRQWVPAVVLVGAGCLFFGLMMALFKGSTYSLQDDLGNLSATWLLLAFWSSLSTSKGRILKGAFLGTVFVELAFFGFYLGESIVFHIGVVPALLDGRIWSTTGLVAGPIFGALGAWERRSGHGYLWLVMTALFVLEPFAYFGYFHLAGLSSTMGHLELLAYGTELAVGVIATVFVIRHFGLIGGRKRALG